MGGVNHNKSPRFLKSGGIENISVAILAENHYASVVVEEEISKEHIERMTKIYRIRKLTPRECYRLMGCSDLNIDLIQKYPYIPDGNGGWILPDGMTESTAKKLSISESQQYKMAGNSIVVDCMVPIFENMLFGSSPQEGESYGELF